MKIENLAIHIRKIALVNYQMHWLRDKRKPLFVAIKALKEYSSNTDTI